eukprot:gene14924-16466_t
MTFLESFRYPITNNQVRLALVRFDKDATVLKHFADDYAVAYTEKLVNDITLRRTGLRMDLALMRASTGIFPQSRKDARKVLVLFTDVSSLVDQNQLRKAMDSLKKQRVTVVVVGIGSRVRFADLVNMVDRSANAIVSESSKSLLYYYYDIYQRIISSSCDSINCKPGATCIPRYDGSPSCSCSQSCSPNYNVVCGDNRKTYASPCLLRYDACLTERPISIMRKGFCDVTNTADIIFMVDVAGKEDSIRAMADFIAQSLPAYNITKNNVRVSLVTYSSEASINLPLNKGTSSGAIQEALKNLAPKQKGRRVDTALYQSIRNWRYVPRNVILFVNGPSTENLSYLKRMVAYLGRHGVQIDVVANDKAKKELLATMTSAGANVIVVKPSEYLNKALHVIQPSPTRAENFNLAFAFGGQVSQPEFVKQKSFIKDIARQFFVDKGRTRVGLIKYGKDASVVQTFKDSATNKELAVLLDNSMLDKPGNNVAEGLRQADTLYQPFNGAQKKSRNVLIVFMDSLTDSDVIMLKRHIDSLRGRKVEILVVGNQGLVQKSALVGLFGSDDISVLVRNYTEFSKPYSVEEIVGKFRKDLCSGVKCRFGACSLTNGVAQCNCINVCSASDSSPVCGVDGRTYSNKCYLQLHSCKIQKSIGIATYGPCAVIGSHDILAVIDVSENIAMQNLVNTQRIFKFLFDQYEVGSGKTNIGIVSYSNVAKNVLTLEEGAEKSLVHNVLLALKKEKGTARLDKALRKVLEILRDRRSVRNVPTSVVVHVSDPGKVNMNEVIKYVSEIRRRGVGVFFVVVSSDKKAKDAFSSKYPFKNDLVLGSEDDIIGEPMTKLLEMVADMNASPRQIDLAFVFGAAGQNAHRDFLLQKDIAKQVIKEQRVSPDGVRIGAVIYGTNARALMPFNLASDKDGTLMAIERIRADNYGDNLKDGLLATDMSLFDSSRGGARKGASKVAIIFYNTPLRPDVATAAKKLRDKRIQLISVAMGIDGATNGSALLDNGRKLTGNNELSVLVKSPQEAQQIAPLLSNTIKSALCASVKCEIYSLCITTHATRRCICPLCESEAEDVRPVCASDGVTYASECRLKATSCRKQRLLTMVKSAPCVLRVTIYLPVTHKPLDLFFLIDTARTVTDPVLKAIKDFIVQQAKIYNVSSDNVRMSLISYDTVPKTVLAMKDGISFKAILEGLSQLTLQSEKRHADKALQHVKDTIVIKKDGVRDNVGKVVVVFMVGSDSSSASTDLKKQAKDLKESTRQIEVVVVGIGSDVKSAEMKAIASKPDNVVAVKGVGDINDATALISAATAKASSTLPNLDVAIVIGESTGNDLEIMKATSIEILKKLPLSQGQTKVGFILYGRDSARVIMWLNNNQQNMIHAVNSIRIGSGNQGLGLSKAIDLTRTELLQEVYGARKGIPKTTFIFVNKNPDLASKSAAKKLTNEGVKIVVLAVGTNVESRSVNELATSDNDVINIFSRNDAKTAAHKALAVRMPDLCKKKSCEYYGKCITRADNTAECVCPLCDATTKYNPVCGDDGMTYASECHLQATACTGRRDLKVAKKTACGVSGALDVVFALDGSSTVTAKTFERMKDFVKGSFKAYNISADGTRIGLMVYGKEAGLALSLKDGTLKRVADQAVDGSGRVGGTRRMTNALEFAHKQLFSLASRPEAGRLLVLMTNGKNDQADKDQLNKAVDALRQSKVSGLVIAIGRDVDRDELKAIADGEKNVIDIRNDDKIADAIGPVMDRSGKAVAKPVRLDLGVMFGADGANADATFRAEKELTKKLIDKYDIAPSAALVGAVVYDSDANLAIRFGDVQSKDNAKNAVDRLQRRRAGHNLLKGLQVARDKLFNEEYGARRSVPKTLLVFVDKKSSKAELEKMAIVAKQLHDAGVKIIVVVIGREVDEKLLSPVISDGTGVVKSTNADSLKDVLPKIIDLTKPDLCKKKSCEYYGKCITRADNTAECVCPLCDATTKYNPVCGDDGMTYASECHLQATACTGRRDLKVAKKTACGVSGALDVVFALDGSSTVTAKTFERMKDFVKGSFKAYNISADGTRIGLMVYGKEAGLALSLKDGTLKRVADQAVDGSGRVGGTRRMTNALEFAHKQLFSLASRPEAGRLLVLMTNGKNDQADKDQLNKAVDALRQSKVSVLVIAIGRDVDRDELKAIADGEKNVIDIRNDDKIADAIGPVMDRSGKAVGKCVCQPVRLDLGVMFGADGANADATFRAEKELTKKLIDKYDIAPSAALVGAVVYDSDANLAIRFGDVQSKDNAKNAVDRLQRRRAGHNLLKGLQVARDKLFNEEYGARRSVPKTLLVFVDKKSSKAELEKMAIVAKQLHDAGVKIIVVVIGREVDEKLLSPVISDGTGIVKSTNADSLKMCCRR